MVDTTTIRVKSGTYEALNSILETDWAQDNDIDSMDALIRVLLDRDELLDKLIEKNPNLEKEIAEIKKQADSPMLNLILSSIHRIRHTLEASLRSLNVFSFSSLLFAYNAVTLNVRGAARVA